MEPLIRRTNVWADREQLCTDSPRETSLDLVLMMLMRYGADFDPLLTIVGSELLPTPETAGATFLATPHTMLSVLITRVVFDRGVMPVAIAAAPVKIYGTQSDTQFVPVPSRTLLVKTRELFATGATVSAMIDRDGEERRTRSVVTSRGEFQISTPLLELALRQHVRILFFTVTVSESWTVIMTIVEPSPNASTIDGLLDEFGAFLDKHVHARG